MLSYACPQRLNPSPPARTMAFASRPPATPVPSAQLISYGKTYMASYLLTYSPSPSPTGRRIGPLTYLLTHLFTYLHSSSPTGRRIGPPASARLSRTSSPGGQARPSHRLPQRHAPEALHWRVRARASTLRGAGSEPSRLGYRIYRGLTSATSTLRCRGRGTGFTRRSRSRLRELSRELISELITLPLEAGQEADAMCSGLWAGWCWLCGSYMDHAGKVSYKL